MSEKSKGKPYIEIIYPPDDVMINSSDARITYQVWNQPPGSVTRIFFGGTELDIYRAGIKINPFRQPFVSESVSSLTPGRWKLDILLEAVEGTLLSRSSTSFDIKIPKHLESIVFHGTFETLEAIEDCMLLNRSCIYMRFGDGELAHAFGKEDQMQCDDSHLTTEIRWALGLSGKGVYKALPLNSDLFGGLEEGMRPGVHANSDAEAIGFVELAVPYWRPLPIHHVWSHVALSHAATTWPDLALDFLVQLRRTRPAVLVGNINIDPDIRVLLFGQQCVFVPSPPSNAFRSIDMLERHAADVLGLPEISLSTMDWTEGGGNDWDDEGQEVEAAGSALTVAVVAMGAPGKALEARLWRRFLAARRLRRLAAVRRAGGVAGLGGPDSGEVERGLVGPERLVVFDFGSVIDAIQFCRLPSHFG